MESAAMAPETATREDEQVLMVAHPALFRQHPFLFLLCVAAIAAFGLGLLLLLGWWIKAQTETLTVTNKRVIRRHGLIAKNVSEVLHRDIRNIQIRQSVMQRLFGVGWIGISSAAQDVIEIEFDGVRSPEGVKELIDRHREL
jgi:uncharacterized membrane protein YdbT with pleckstrin-like domain